MDWMERRNTELHTFLRISFYDADARTHAPARPSAFFNNGL